MGDELQNGYAVAALLLGEVERPVAATKDLKPRGVGGEHGGDAEAGGEVDLLAEMLDGEAGETEAEILGDLGGAGVGGIGQDGNELFAAQAGNVVDVTEIVAKAACGTVQNCISPIVAMGIVDGFEAVEVEDDQGESGAPAAGDVDGFGADLLERAAIEQAGKRVSLRLPFELKLELRHGEPDDTEGSHDGDQDGGEKGKGAGAGGRYQTTGIV